MPLKLRPDMEAFEIVDGPWAGRRFVHGRHYRDIPPEHGDKFVNTDIITDPPAMEAIETMPPEESTGGEE